jgi:hypothetical protein
LSDETPLLSARGLFWLSGSAELMTEDTATRGTLTIDTRGKIELKLDNDEWKWGERSETLDVVHSRRFEIVGCLIDSDQYVRLERAFVTSSHPFSPTGCMVTALSAFVCLVSDRTSHDLRSQAFVNVIRIPLGPLRAWLDRPMPATVKAGAGFEVHYPAEPEFTYQLAMGQLSVESWRTAHSDFTTRALTVTHEAWMAFQLNEPKAITKVAELHSDIEDLLILLTDYEVALDWPVIRFADKDVNGTLYCTRRSTKEVTFSAIECWLVFSSIQENFGAIVERWLGLRQEFGPAFHLYLGTRRGVELYEEHRFVNLIWGLESLHRHTGAAPDTPRIAAKIERIMDSVNEELNARDRKLLKGQLNVALGPSLADRLYATFAELPLRVTNAELSAFAKRCADRRNDISHRGGPMQRGDYNPFVLELHHLTGALSHLYHAAILLRIGITAAQIQDIFFEKFGSFKIRSRLHDAGLCPKPPPQLEAMRAEAYAAASRTLHPKEE